MLWPWRKGPGLKPFVIVMVFVRLNPTLNPGFRRAGAPTLSPKATAKAFRGLGTRALWCAIRWGGFRILLRGIAEGSGGGRWIVPAR
jgi:hypothetical protein